MVRKDMFEAFLDYLRFYVNRGNLGITILQIRLYLEFELNYII